MVEKKYLTIDDVHGLTHNIIRQMINDNWRPDYVVGITRGGLVPALLISHYLQIPMYTLKVSLRDDEGSESNLWMPEDAFGYIPEDLRETPEQVSDPSLRKRILIVDDINDTGASLNWLMDDWEKGCMPAESAAWDSIWGDNIRMAVLYDNLASKCRKKMNYIGEEINKAEKDCWIVFPWENWWEKK